MHSHRRSLPAIAAAQMRYSLLHSALILVAALPLAGCAPAEPDKPANAAGGTKALRLTTKNFEQEVLRSDVPVLVDFWATWCGPCQMMDPVIQELAAEFAGKAKVGKVDVDDNPELSDRYHVSGIPRFIVFKGGQPVGGATGVVAKGRLADILKKSLE